MDRAGEKETYPNYTSGLSREEDWARLSPSSFLGDREEVQCSLSVEAGGNGHKCVGGVDVGPNAAMTFGVALAFMPRLWTLSRKNGYITGSDFVRDKFGSRVLAILIAITGIVALLPYIALQIVGMQAVLAAMLYGVAGSNTTLVEEISLVIAFIILAAFTFTSGLRGATLTAVYKDILVWFTVIVVIVSALWSIGGFGQAFANVPKSPDFLTVSSSLVPGT